MNYGPSTEGRQGRTVDQETGKGPKFKMLMELRENWYSGVLRVSD
jgi:hypothetical protein